MHTYLSEWRRFRRLGQKQLAAKAGISLQHLSNVELGRKAFNSVTLEKLADALSCTTTELVAVNPVTYGGMKLSRIVRGNDPEHLEEIAAIFSSLARLVRTHPERVQEAVRVAQQLSDHSHMRRKGGTQDSQA
ncbi:MULTISPECIES: helix-turn-helix domain-containing protein [Rhizobium/Agrobacterium group]|uniref:HTH cro/C1-type domain-containing protein n=1 Tax=Allorhizobium ampelinum (strain ATCC BAA-846 / DSM 112012 / S4) TaxID=311402 RepID=B9K2Q9_ALLAM|nr:MULTISPECIES: helix-turn-helix transcriptional regulator [Rhizobium/Agrobacterium group]ACM39157.1 hypothetical protein Avi_6164 [Allorhizobium ampelinum S4]MUO30807.1 helix-turn-helix domain-containing protein [Agrobacterium vitis]